ncbi:MAG: DUF58 domain-containing protein [Streptosporangiales bacterium]|nr:DUF58 domain-containing protein [Streptosporangiales bacterium]
MGRMTETLTRSFEVFRRLELVVTRRLDGLLHGDHESLFPGPGSEPADARTYLPGSDDVRRMDWNVTARTSEPHVRDLVADRELETWMVVDASASMDFGTGQAEKRDLAIAAVAAVGFLTERTGNRVGAYVLRGRTPRRIPARTGRSHLFSLLNSLASGERAAEGSGSVGLGDALRLLARTQHRRGLIVVISDFLDGGSPPPWEQPIRLLGTRHQLLAVEVTDPRELTLPEVGMLTLVDPETGRRREVSTASARLRERYAEAARAQRAEVAAALRRAGAAHLRLRTDEDWLRAIVRHVMAQRRLARLTPPTGGGAA